MLALAQEHLRKDTYLASLINKLDITLPNKSQNFFRDLVESIVSQQLSVKAANTIFNRFIRLFPEASSISPQTLIQLSETALRQVGLSRQKSLYLHHLSHAVLSKDLILDELDNLSDQQVVDSLTQVKGIGQWTAEMFLIFSLARLDVFSLGDLGLQTAISRLYSVDRHDLATIHQISSTWSPYRSVASLYLWKSLENT